MFVYRKWYLILKYFIYKNDSMHISNIIYIEKKKKKIREGIIGKYYELRN